MSGAPDTPSRFDDPWQAQIFALTLALSEAGHFTWPDWTQALGAALKERGANRPLDGGQDYFAAWLAALETLLARRGLALPAEVEATRAAWERAYLSTPHGQPVNLAAG